MRLTHSIARALFVAFALVAAVVSTARAGDACCDLSITVSPFVACPITINSITFQSGPPFPGVSLLPGASMLVTKQCPNSPLVANISTGKTSVNIPLGSVNVPVQISEACCVRVTLVLAEPPLCYSLHFSPC